MPGRLLLALAATAALLALAAPAATAAVGLSDASSVGPAKARQATVPIPGECPESISLDAPRTAQEQAMLCLVNDVRERYGLAPLTASQPLHQSAVEKGGDLISCNEFSHTACGREFAHWIRETGYTAAECWRVGENLAWGVDEQGTVAAIFRAWMRSPTHRENILGDFGEIGIDLRVGPLGGLSGVHIWTQHFGSHCS
jgi:uncharacterized protein YkwD